MKSLGNIKLKTGKYAPVVLAKPPQPKQPKNKKATTKLVNRLIKSKAETKRVMYYSGGALGVTDPGDYAHWAYRSQNQYITSNTSDIMRLIPYVGQGTSDNNRLGQRINPVSLTVKGNIAVSTTKLVPHTPCDIFAVMYVLQHVSLKSYTALAAQNLFTQLLETGENATVGFGGIALHASLPVSKQYYKLLTKKVIRLRYSGTTNATGTPATFSLANSHSYNVPFSLNLTKHIPKRLMYPENNVTSGLNDPTNSSIFLAIAYYNYDQSQPSDPDTAVAIQYHSELLYKDM